MSFPEILMLILKGINTSTQTALDRFFLVVGDYKLVALLRAYTVKDEARLFYANDAATRRLGVREPRRQIGRKAFERREIANAELTKQSAIPFNVFKDPYLLDVLGLKDNYLEADLEEAVLIDLEAFILEFGHGFAFIERQKRMTLDELNKGRL